MIDDCAHKKKENIEQYWLVLFEFFSEILNLYYLIVGEDVMGKTSWMISDEVNSLASKRMACLVCRCGQSNSSALLMLCSSVLGECSYRVF